MNASLGFNVKLYRASDTDPTQRLDEGIFWTAILEEEAGTFGLPLEAAKRGLLRYLNQGGSGIYFVAEVFSYEDQTLERYPLRVKVTLEVTNA